MSNSDTPSSTSQTANWLKQIKDLADSSSRGLTSFFTGTILSVVGFALGVVILFFDYFRFSQEEMDFVGTSQFKLFVLVIIAQTVFWAVAIGSMWASLGSLMKYKEGHKIEIFIWALLFGILIYSSRSFAVSCEYYLRNHNLKMDLLTYTGGVVAVIAGLGSILVNIGLRSILATNLRDEELTKERNYEKVQGILVTYLSLRGNLIHFLSLLGMMLGLVTLAQGAKRNAILASATSNCPAGFPVDRVMLFGLYYTLILVLTFLPTFSILITTGRKLRDDILPIPSPHSKDWDSWCAKRKKLDQVLALSLTESLRAMIAIAAPIIGSLIPLYKN